MSVSSPSSTIVVPKNQGQKFVKAVSILRTKHELYTFWRNFENLPLIIKHPVQISVLSPTESLWSVSGPPVEKHVEWRARVINDVPDALIAWQTVEGAGVPHAGTVRFEDAPTDEGTEVTVALEYDAPAGKLGELYAKLTGKEPSQQVSEALRRLKALMEAGEIPTTEGQPVGGSQRKKKGKK